MNVKILVCHHTAGEVFANESVRPILLGAALRGESVVQFLSQKCAAAGRLNLATGRVSLGGGAATTSDRTLQRGGGIPLLRDDVGENISRLNPYFCELTALYWAWKNPALLENPDYIGLFHYRRVLDFSEKLKLKNPFDINRCRTPRDVIARFGLDGANLAAVLKDADLITPTRILGANFEEHCYLNQYEIYARDHHKKDLDIVLDIVRERFPECEEALEKVFFTKHRKLAWWNMFVMRRALFEEYCAFIFGVLFEAQKRIDLTYYPPYQARIFGFLCERLSNVFFVHKTLTSHVRTKSLNAWYLKPRRPMFGWIVEGKMKRFYLGGFRVLKKPL